MSRLLLLNVLLLAGIAMATLKLLELRDETARREEMVHAGAPKLPTAKGTSGVAQPERTVAANYLDIAARLLFSKDRNPTVIVPPAPVKAIPAFPFAYGVLMIADPPIIMMAAQKGQPQKGYRAGDRIADFKIVNFDARTIVFEWDGQKFTKNVQELVDRDAQSAALLNRQNIPAPSEAAAPAAAPSSQSLAGGSSSPQGLGADMGGGLRACNAADTAPAGTVSDGYRKVISESPFGKVCRWEKLK